MFVFILGLRLKPLFAADELGLYLYTETDAWIRISTPEQKDFLMQEGDLHSNIMEIMLLLS